jgi:hypothetical protein
LWLAPIAVAVVTDSASAATTASKSGAILLYLFT